MLNVQFQVCNKWRKNAIARAIFLCFFLCGWILPQVFFSARLVPLLGGIGAKFDRSCHSAFHFIPSFPDIASFSFCMSNLPISEAAAPQGQGAFFVSARFMPPLANATPLGFLLYIARALSPGSSSLWPARLERFFASLVPLLGGFGAKFASSCHFAFHFLPSFPRAASFSFDMFNLPISNAAGPQGQGVFSFPLVSCRLWRTQRPLASFTIWLRRLSLRQERGAGFVKKPPPPLH